MTMTEIPVQIGGFEILGSLGRGGMGIVYCVRDHSLQRDLAVKVQSGDWKRHPELLQRFLREARILAKINHPHVVQIYSVGEHGGAPFFAMELLEGSIADAARTKAPDVVQLKRWMLEAARGLAAIHEMGVVHRDIKPGNLLLTRPTSVETEHVKVADLGIASAGEQFGEPLTRAGAVLGTTGYLAPEAFRLEHTLDSRADQYSLGVVFFELLANRSPYADMGDRALLAAIIEPRSPPDVRQFRPEVDAATSAILARMLNDDPEQRFENTAALVRALAAVQGAPLPLPAAPIVADSPAADARPATALPAADVAAPPSPRPLGPSPGSGRRQALTLVLLLLLLVCLAGAQWLGLLARREPGAAPAASTAVPTIDLQHREAWAKYLLAHYLLRSRAAGEKVWTLDLLKQRAGLLTAELKGPESTPIALSGYVESQHSELMDGAEWDIYQLKLEGAEGRLLQLRIELTGDEAEGEGAYSHQDNACASTSKIPRIFEVRRQFVSVTGARP